MFYNIIGIITLCWLISFLLTWKLARPQALVSILDYPNERSLHTVATARTGGIAILTSLISGYFVASLIGYLPEPTIHWIAVGTLSLGLISLWEDVRGLPAKLRLSFHFLAASLLILAGLTVTELRIGTWHLSINYWLAWIVTLLSTVWFTNLYNFMDGIDGLAGGMAVIGFGTLAIIGWQTNAGDFFLINSMIAAAAAGFLVWNFPPARIFMGDSGSITLGFLAAAMGLWGNHEKILDFWITLLIFSPFIVDATVTLFRRAWNGEKIGQPHRSHYYQRLASSGLGHRQTTLLWYLMMLVCAATAILANKLSWFKHFWLIMLWLMLYGSIIWRIEIWLQKRSSNK